MYLLLIKEKQIGIFSYGATATNVFTMPLKHVAVNITFHTVAQFLFVQTTWNNIHQTTQSTHHKIKA